MQIHRFNFRADEFRRDPWSVYTRFREAGPVIRIKIPFLGTSWAATTYELVNEVLKNDQQFVRDPVNAGRKNMIPLQWLLPRSFKNVMHNMLAADGDKHRRLRSVADSAFDRRNVDSMEERLTVLADEQLDLAAHSAEKSGSVDLLQEFMRPFPLTVICELLGLPLEDRPKFRKWFEPFSTVSSVWGMFTIARGIGQINSYLYEQFEEVRRQPREGLMSELVQLSDADGARLSPAELVSTVFLLLVAGHETTVHLISNAVLTLLQHPDERQRLQSDWPCCDRVIEEVLRYASPIQMAKPRYVAEDMDFHGVPLRRGEMMTPLLASANYDPQRFESPLEFRPDRDANYHMTFGSGPHTCLGMKLARAETRVALRTLLTRWPDLQAAFDLTQPAWNARPGLRGMVSFAVRTS